MTRIASATQMKRGEHEPKHRYPLPGTEVRRVYDELRTGRLVKDLGKHRTVLIDVFGCELLGMKGADGGTVLLGEHQPDGTYLPRQLLPPIPEGE